MQADNKSYDDINVTPMVDLYLVLLLIFIIMTTAGVQGIKVNLPRGGPASSKPIEGPKMQAITVNNEGKVFLNTISSSNNLLLTYSGLLSDFTNPDKGNCLSKASVDTIMAAKDGDRLHLVREVTDMWFHTMVLLSHFDLGVDDVLVELRRREGISGIDEKNGRAAGA